MLENYTRAAGRQLSEIEQCIRYRYWAEAIDEAEKMQEILARLIAEMRKEANEDRRQMAYGPRLLVPAEH